MSSTTKIPSPCFNWQFDLVVPGYGLGDHCASAIIAAKIDAFNSAEQLADAICAHPFGCQSNFKQINKVEVEFCRQVPQVPNEYEASVRAYITFTCA